MLTPRFSRRHPFINISSIKRIMVSVEPFVRRFIYCISYNICKTGAAVSRSGVINYKQSAKTKTESPLLPGLCRGFMSLADCRSSAPGKIYSDRKATAHRTVLSSAEYQYGIIKYNRRYFQHAHFTLLVDMDKDRCISIGPW